jgi:hypothetical protein
MAEIVCFFLKNLVRVRPVPTQSDYILSNAEQSNKISIFNKILKYTLGVTLKYIDLIHTAQKNYRDIELWIHFYILRFKLEV